MFLNTLIKRLSCLAAGHDLYTARLFSETARKVSCLSCGGCWLVDGKHKKRIQPDADVAELYRFLRDNSRGKD